MPEGGCEHEWGEVEERRFEQGNKRSPTDRDHGGKGAPEEKTATGSTCRRCRAWRGELGLEPRVEDFIAHLLEVFAAVRRVLRDDATLWVNLGDSYGSAGGTTSGGTVFSNGRTDGSKSSPSDDARLKVGRACYRNRPSNSDLPAGSLLQVPARFALAMQGAGWLLRSAIVLAKAAPMPESVTGTQWVRCRVKVKAKELTGTRKAVHAPQHSNNVPLPGADAEYSPCPGCAKCAATDGMVLRWGMGRPTSAYEYLFLFSKGGRYFYNSEAVRVPQAEGPVHPRGRGKFTNGRDQIGQGAASRWTTLADGGIYPATVNPAGANARNVLKWQPQPLSDAHYAAFPPFIPRFAILAGTAEQVCGECGAPYAPVLSARPFYGDCRQGRRGQDLMEGKNEWRGTKGAEDYEAPKVVGSRPTCRHHAPPAAATVLDPFCGSGTTLMVAERLGRDAVGVDLQPDYVAIAERRASADAGLFGEVSVCEGLPESNGHAQLAWEW